ncbi:MAG: thiamine pyrophosphate-binding protein [Gammaproteobacteria bacterium]|nr:thiamine pyrophosphate-binding protein [Gammaproteobacteria bacterium]
MVHGGILTGRTFKQMGVECIFTLSGGHIMPIYVGCVEQGIKIIDVRHEQAAAHAADAWARLNPGNVGVAVVTAGPGVTDAVTGVANAWRANSPILVIGGQGPFANLHRGSLQEMDHVALMKPITKWAGACYDTARIPEFIEIAIRHAVTGIPGPVFLEIPMDVLMKEVVEDDAPIPEIRTTPPLIAPQSAEIRRALDVLDKVERPLLMAGTSIKWSRAQQALQAFLDKTRIPAYANGMGRGTIPAGSSLLFNRTRREAIKNCDCIILAGCILDFRMNFGANIPQDAKIIQLEMDNLLIGQNRHTDVALVGNLACTLEEMLKLSSEEGRNIDFSAYSAELRGKEDALAEALAAEQVSAAVPIESSRFCREVAQFVGNDDDMIVIGDGGDIVAASAKVVPIPKNGLWMDPGPLGTLGVGAPFALAAQTTYPDRKVLIIYGDGSFGLNGMEFDTAVRFNLPIVGIVGNDAAWGQMMRPQGAMYGEHVAVMLNHTRYDKMVEALGGHGERVTQPDQIQPALNRAYASGKPALVNVELKRDTDYKGGGYI